VKAYVASFGKYVSGQADFTLRKIPSRNPPNRKLGGVRNRVKVVQKRIMSCSLGIEPRFLSVSNPITILTACRKK
jgi:hypothetical protein